MDPYFKAGNPPTGLGRNAYAITPSDTNDLFYISKVWVGFGGDLKVTPADAADGTYVTIAVPSGQWCPVVCKRVWAATTATGLFSVIG
jgi:hypothetical protein